MWNQIYDPLNNTVLSTIAAALPVVTLLVLIASGKVKAHIAAVIALIVANIITILIYAMPAGMSVRASLLGVVAGFFPDRLDRPQRHLPLPGYGRNRAL
jgi:lactate permease